MCVLEHLSIPFTCMFIPTFMYVFPYAEEGAKQASSYYIDTKNFTYV